MPNDKEYGHPKTGITICVFAVGIILATALAIILWRDVLYPGGGYSGPDPTIVLWLMISAVIVCGILLYTYVMRKKYEEYIGELVNKMQEISCESNSANDNAGIMDELHFKDALTGIRNRMAYECEVKRLEWGISSNTAEFGIATIDVDGLGKINQSYGHEKGNLALKNLSDVICKVFSHSAVFRFGDDEFVVILEKKNNDESESLITDFNHRMEENARKTNETPWEAVTATLGYAKFESGVDKTVRDVLERAEKDMQNRKTGQ